MFIYIDDILVYSMAIEKDGKHFEYFLNKFQQNQFFANRAKNVFTQKGNGLLGPHFVEGRGEAQL